MNFTVELTSSTSISVTWKVYRIGACAPKLLSIANFCPLQPPTPGPHFSVLYYIVSHNISEDGRVMVFNTSTILEGAELGQIYYIEVYAVNAVGEGSMSTRILITGEHSLLWL